MLTRAHLRCFLVLCAAMLAVAACSGDESGGSVASPGVGAGSSGPAAPNSTSSPSGSPTRATPKVVVATTTGAPATGPVGRPSVAVSSAPPVKLGKVAAFSGDVRVMVGNVQELTVKAEQPGEIAGPAAAVQVTVANDGAKPFSLDGMVVTASYAKGTPGDQTNAAPAKPLRGFLASGKRVHGTYVFMVPRKYAPTLHVEVSSNQSPVVVQFDR